MDARRRAPRLARMTGRSCLARWRRSSRRTRRRRAESRRRARARARPRGRAQGVVSRCRCSCRPRSATTRSRRSMPSRRTDRSRRSLPRGSPAGSCACGGRTSARRAIEASLDGAGRAGRARRSRSRRDAGGDHDLGRRRSRRLVLVSSFAKGVLTPRLRFPAKDGVRAIGVCPPEEKGVPGVVAVVGNEVWLVR